MSDHARHLETGRALHVTETLKASGVTVRDLPVAVQPVLGVHMTVTCTRAPEDSDGVLMSVTPRPRCGGFQLWSGWGAERSAAGAFTFGLGVCFAGVSVLVGAAGCVPLGLAISPLLAAVVTEEVFGVAVGAGLGRAEAPIVVAAGRGMLGEVADGVGMGIDVATFISGVGKEIWTSPRSA